MIKECVSLTVHVHVTLLELPVYINHSELKTKTWAETGICISVYILETLA